MGYPPFHAFSAEAGYYTLELRSAADAFNISGVLWAPYRGGDSSDEYTNASKRDCDRILRTYGKKVAGKARKTPDNNADERQYVSLCEQIRSSQIAERAARHTVGQFWIGLVSLILLFATTAAAIAAACYAAAAVTEGRRAAREAKRSADAAVDGVDEARTMNEITRDAILIQQRAWLKILRFDAIIVGHEHLGSALKLIAKVTNTGNGPALKAMIAPPQFVDEMKLYDASTMRRILSLPESIGQSGRIGVTVFPGDEETLQLVYHGGDPIWTSENPAVVVSVTYKPLANAQAGHTTRAYAIPIDYSKIVEAQHKAKSARHMGTVYEIPLRPVRLVDATT